MKFEQKQNDSIILLSERQNKKDYLPEVGKTYIVYNDGKINFNRIGFTTITKMVDLDSEEIPQEDMEWIKEEINDCPWLYDSEQHKIVYATDGDDTTIFLMTYGGFWFSLGWLKAGQLDIDGSLTKSMFKYYKKYGSLDDIKSSELFIEHKELLEKYLQK